MGQVLIGSYPKKKGETVYYTPYMGHGFSLPKLGPDGKPIQKSNPVTGTLLANPNGDPIYVEEKFRFTQWRTRFSEIGYWAVFIVTKDTPKRVADKLKEDAAKRNSPVLTEKQFYEKTNPELASYQAEESEKDIVIQSQADAIAELTEKLKTAKVKK